MRYPVLRSVLMWAACFLLPALAYADPPKIKRILPPAGVEISKADQDKIAIALADFEKELASAKKKLDEEQADLLPDIEIYHKAARFALDLGEFYKAAQVDDALKLIETGRKRLKDLVAGREPWTEAKGFVVRGYRSELDGSVQPFGLVIPEKINFKKKPPIYVWLHGREENTLDLQFITQCAKSGTPIGPNDGIVLHVFGRYCNAFKFAGERDVWEAIDRVIDEYTVREDRHVLVGFSMGGAGAWHLAGHYPDQWIAACPGAGFVDVKRYQHLSEDKLPSWYEQKLWGWYDVPPYVRNMFNYPVIAYSGELDKQKESADIMEQEFSAEGKRLTRIIGPKMGHDYEAESLKEIQRRLKTEADKPEATPRELTFQTRTLHYNECCWLHVQGLIEHWADSRVDAAAGETDKSTEQVSTLTMTTRNIAAFEIEPPTALGKINNKTILKIDNQTIAVNKRETGYEKILLQQANGVWGTVGEWDDTIRKAPGLQGPIDDAFMGPFLVVKPTGTAAHPKVQAWVEEELAHFLDRWKRLFRGEVRVKQDTDVTEADIAAYNLIVWGDAASNRILAKALDKLPLQWSEQSVQIAGKTFAADKHVPCLIYPNPLDQPKASDERWPHYLVINSGITFREAHDGTNSQQTPKLPDWAVIDLSQPPDDKSPGKVVAADFFDEQWKLKQAK